MPGTCHQCLTQSKAVFSADLGSRLTLLFEVQVDPPLVTSLISQAFQGALYLSASSQSPGTPACLGDFLLPFSPGA
jgi:hypothetical protein